jgi:DNA-binding SARP family transcriptional activator
LIRSYAASGQRSAALRQYERLQESLRREFGTEPSPSSQQLREEILAGHTAVYGAPPTASSIKVYAHRGLVTINKGISGRLLGAGR